MTRHKQFVCKFLLRQIKFFALRRYVVADGDEINHFAPPYDCIISCIQKYVTQLSVAFSKFATPHVFEENV
ncbi:MAG TPA: hypothetical protein DD626_03585 [Clostridiales bacterium]|nr:hypothetical protein [Clostridiales bacterium]